MSHGRQPPLAHECRPTEPAASRWLNALVRHSFSNPRCKQRTRIDPATADCMLQTQNPRLGWLIAVGGVGKEDRHCANAVIGGHFRCRSPENGMHSVNTRRRRYHAARHQIKCERSALLTTLQTLKSPMISGGIRSRSAARKQHKETTSADARVLMRRSSCQRRARMKDRTLPCWKSHSCIRDMTSRTCGCSFRPTPRLTYRRGGGRLSAETIIELEQSHERKARAAARCRRIVSSSASARTAVSPRGRLALSLRQKTIHLSASFPLLGYCKPNHLPPAESWQ